jgi:hypothetical protein
MNGSKGTIILGAAAGTGVNLQAIPNSGNTKRRVQIFAEIGWSVEGAVQLMGRTHRSYQDSAPIYVLMTTNCPAEKRVLYSFVTRMQKMVS